MPCVNYYCPGPDKKQTNMGACDHWCNNCHEMMTLQEAAALAFIALFVGSVLTLLMCIYHFTHL